MDMQDLSVESDKKEVFGAGKLMQNPKAEKEAESHRYSTLQRPNEDVYAEVFPTGAPFKAKAGYRTVGKPRLYQAVCIMLTVVCLVLLLVTIVLSKKLLFLSCWFTPCSDPSPLPDCKVQRCSDGWLTFDRSCFFLSTVRLDWDESQRNCSARGGSLAVISNPLVQDFLTKKGNVQYWIGLRQNSGTWTWIDNAGLQTSYWADASQGGDCAILTGGIQSVKNWKTASCKSRTYFICQLKM
uniref:C-type lectin domain-containing protein n=1 Tax=Mola mola TaxID=94237 RepID=A0A3Q3W8Q4_MOLML